MQCPGCNVGIHFEVTGYSSAFLIPGRGNYGRDIAWGHCPECSALIIILRVGPVWFDDDDSEHTGGAITLPSLERIIEPRSALRRLASTDGVPQEVIDDFHEAAAVVAASPKASAAISRRLLQHVLVSALSATGNELSKQIDQALATKSLPGYLAEAVDAIRVVGNFAAHPTKDRNTGEILPVEPGEAEFLLDTLESLVDFAYVQPKRLAESRRLINEKLARAGKPPMKGGA